MKQDVLKHFDLTWLPVTALIIFLVCFGIYTLWTFSKANKQGFEEASLIPLEDPKSSGSSIKKGKTV